MIHITVTNDSHVMVSPPTSPHPQSPVHLVKSHSRGTQLNPRHKLVVQNFSSTCFILFCKYCSQRRRFCCCCCCCCFLPQIRTPLGADMLVCSLQMESRNRFTQDIFNTLPDMLALCMYDVTNTDSWAQNGSTHSPVFGTQTSFLNKLDEKSSKNLCIYIFLNSIPINRACDTSSVQHPFKVCASSRQELHDADN